MVGSSRVSDFTLLPLFTARNRTERTDSGAVAVAGTAGRRVPSRVCASVLRLVVQRRSRPRHQLVRRRTTSLLRLGAQRRSQLEMSAWPGSSASDYASAPAGGTET